VLAPPTFGNQANKKATEGSWPRKKWQRRRDYWPVFAEPLSVVAADQLPLAICAPTRMVNSHCQTTNRCP